MVAISAIVDADATSVAAGITKRQLAKKVTWRILLELSFCSHLIPFDSEKAGKNSISSR